MQDPAIAKAVCAILANVVARETSGQWKGFEPDSLS